jgi:GT2 family glycosyltransferase
MIRADLLKTIGLLDEDYFFSGEMADFCRRTRMAGWTCAISSQSIAIHEPQFNAVRETLYLYYTLRNRFLFIRRHEPKQLQRLFMFWLGCGTLMAVFACLRGRPAQARAALLAMRDGLKGRLGNRNELFGL